MALLGNSHSMNPEGVTRLMDPLVGGQNGPTTDPLNWMAADDYTRQNMVCVMIKEPTLMQYMPDGLNRVAMLKAIFELLPTGITGLTSTVTAEYAETNVGHAGELHHTLTRVSRAASVPVFTVPEKPGLMIAKFMTDWLEYLGQDPETNHPKLITSAEWEGAGSPEFTADGRTAVCLFYEPSIELNAITWAWLTVNMMPKTGGVIEGTRTTNAGREVVEQSIEFTGTTIIGTEVVALAKQHLDSLNRDGLDGYGLPVGYTGAQPNVDAGTAGYAELTEAMAAG